MVNGTPAGVAFFLLLLLSFLEKQDILNETSETS